MTYLLAHDLGTTGNKAPLYRDDGLLAERTQGLVNGKAAGGIRILEEFIGVCS